MNLQGLLFRKMEISWNQDTAILLAITRGRARQIWVCARNEMQAAIDRPKPGKLK
jgi:hypothetical protein